MMGFLDFIGSKYLLDKKITFTATSLLIKRDFDRPSGLRFLNLLPTFDELKPIL
jgi:hypothetical protein